MGNEKPIWDHEARQTDIMARRLVSRDGIPQGMKRLFLPRFVTAYSGWWNKVRLTRKNLLFTKKLAFGAAQEIAKGKDRSLQLGAVDAKTRQLILAEQKGLYTEKIRKKQLIEIGLLTDHYVRLLESAKGSYVEIVKEVYQTRAEYRSFMDELERAEAEVIRAVLSTVRKGSKKERIDWFARVQEITKEARIAELDHVFPNSR